RRSREGADGRRDRDGGGSATGTSARCHGRASGNADSSPSEHPDPHPDLLRGKARLQLDDRVLAILAHKRVDLLDFHLEEVLERFLDLVSRRLSAAYDLEAIAVFPVFRLSHVAHVHGFLCNVSVLLVLAG